MKLIEILKRWHAWLKAHQAYALALLAAFPEIWASSTAVQQYLPATVVSHLAAAAVAIRFGMNVRATLKALPEPDDTDKAGA
jgi:hypothetical protein